MKMMALPIVICTVCGVCGVMAGCVNIGTPRGDFFAAWDFTLGGLLLGMAIAFSVTWAVDTCTNPEVHSK